MIILTAGTKPGYKLLTLSFFDGKSSIPLDCSSMPRRAGKGDYSLYSAKERKGLFRKKRDADTAQATNDGENLTKRSRRW